MHPKFSQSIDLSLPKDAEQMDAVTVEKYLKDLMARYKKADSGWRGSGNGKNGKAKRGESVRLMRVNGTNYNLLNRDKGLQEEEKKEEDEYENEGEETDATILYVDDDRWKFCLDDLAVAYFWAMVELHELSTFVTQNVEKIGFSSDGDNVSSARTRGSAATKARQSQRDKHLESMINKLPKMMENALKSFMPDPMMKELRQVEDQYRKSLALYYQA